MKQRYHRFGILTCLLLFLLTGNIVAQTNEENQQTYTTLMKQKNYGDAIRLMDKVLKDKESKTAENYYKRAAAYAAIDTDHQHYTFSEMLTDLDSIAKRYPDFVSYELDSATTLLGHRLPVVTLGNRSARHHIMVQATMHAREYMATQLTMALLEHYAQMCYQDICEYKGQRISNLLQQVCFVIIPMVNPDGVEIAQNGSNGQLTDEVKQWVRQTEDNGTSHTKIKANANGVDINRNFGNGFNNPFTSSRKTHRSFNFYSGLLPYSEPESQLMLRVSQRYDYDLFLNYHTSGNIIYYGCQNAKKYVNKLAHDYAKLIHCHTNYPLYGPDSAPAGGTWADDVEIIYQCPSVTVELGTTNPVPISEFPAIFEKHKNVWADLAIEVLDNP